MTSERVSIESYRRLTTSALEDQFAAELNAAGLSGYVRQYQFGACIGRKWAADFAWVERGVLCEIEGGTWRGGRHRSFRGFIDDCRKYTSAAVLGWRVLRYTSADVAERLSECIEEVRAVVVDPSTAK